MNHLYVTPGQLGGSILTPPSKSHTLRAILFGALANGKSTIRNYLPSTDAQAMIDGCRALGAVIEQHGTALTIVGVQGKIGIADDVINAGNSGIVLRFLTAIAALSSHPIVITGDHSIRHQRPMLPLIHALQQMGVQAISTKGDGYAPLIVQGPLHADKVEVDGTDSQPVSALLIAGSLASGPIEVNVRNPGEKPWIEMTLDWMRRVGLPYTREGDYTYKLPGRGVVQSIDYTVPGDWSSASFPLAAALVTGSEVAIHNVDLEDCQGDKKIVEVFQKMGAKLHYNSELKTLSVLNGARLKGIQVDINDFVDAVPILAVVACYAEGETQIIHAAVAKQKECDRLACIASELSKMGAQISETADGLKIKGTSLKGATLTSYYDHRMAMALAVASLGAEGVSCISQPHCVAKTFPTFVHDFQQLGAQFEVSV